MWHVGMSKRGDGEIVYEPPAGPTIQEAIKNAIDIAKEERKPVELHVNDVVLTVNAGSDSIKLFGRYLIKLDQRYRHERERLQAKIGENQK